MTGLLNISAEDAEEYSESLAKIGEGWVEQIVWSFRQGIPQAMGMSRIEWRRKYYGHLKIGDPTERESTAKELAAEGLNNSQIADALGVSEGTVRNDLSDDSGGDSQDYESDADTGENGQVDPPAPDTDSQDYESDEPLWPVEESDDEADHDAESESDTSDAPDPEPPSPPAEPKPLIPAEPGWHQLGDHLLYCGDSTDDEFIAACKGVFAFADPPYNAGKATWDEGFEWKHDYLAEVADIVAVTPGIAALKGFHTVTDMPYQWSVAAEITNGMTRGALGFGNWIYVALFSNGSLYRNAKDYLRVPAHTSDDKGGGHAARKPLRLLTELIGLFTSKGDTVIDPFLGSGTTLMAAEKTGRRCIGAEIDPMHCADIIARYNAAVSS